MPDKPKDPEAQNAPVKKGETDDTSNPEEQVFELDEEQLQKAIADVVAKNLDEKLKPVAEAITELDQWRKKAQPSLVGQIGDPTDGTPARDDGLSPQQKALQEWERQRSVRKDLLENAKPEYSFNRAIAALVAKDWSLAPFELEVSHVVCKNLEWASGSGGGLWVPEQFLGNEFIELLRAKTVTKQAGARVLPNLSSSPVLIPRLGGGVTIYWVGQGEDITESDVTPEQISLDPHGAAAYTVLSRLQNYLQSGSEALLKEDLTDALALATDTAVLRGTGTNGQPLGMANLAGNTLDLAGTVGVIPDIDDLYDMQYLLMQDNIPGPYAWIMNPRELTTFLKTKDTNGNYLVQPDPTRASRGFLLGWPIYDTTTCRVDLGGTSNQGEFFLARMSDVLIGEWGVIQLETSTEAKDHFEKHEMALKIIQWMDVDVRHELNREA
jgi:HK97 family phage major capsid protein